MNLYEKDKLDFTDAHLWAEGSYFTTIIDLFNVGDVQKLLKDFDVKIYAHDMRGHENYDCKVEFYIKTMRPDETKEAMELAVMWMIDRDKPIRFVFDSIGCELDSGLNIKDRWSINRLLEG